MPYQLKPHSLPDARRSGVEDALARDMEALLPQRDVGGVHRRKHPDDDLLRCVIAWRKSLCDVEAEAVIPAPVQNFSCLSGLNIATA